MNLLISNLPDRAAVGDLENFFRGFHRNVRFRFEFSIQPDGSKVRYAIASFDSEKTALKALGKLQQRPLFNQTLFLREYFHRSYNNERRALGWRNKPWDGEERRVQDRRNHAAFVAEDEFEQILKGAPKEEAAPTSDNILVRAYRGMARKF